MVNSFKDNKLTITRFFLSDWLPVCKASSLKIIPLNKIDKWLNDSSADLFEKTKMKKLYLCDERYPGILYEYKPDKYQIIDGTHRILKQLNQNKTTGIFFVLNKEDIKSIIN